MLRRIFSILIGVSLAGATPSLRAVDPIPESQQAALALKLLDAYHGTAPIMVPKKLHVVYFTPADREPEPRYQERLEAVLEDIRTFYRDGMERAGFGPKTFDLERDAEGKCIFHLVKGKQPQSAYPKLDPQKIYSECKPILEAAGISVNRETVLIICNLATWDEKARAFRNDHSPYNGYSTQTHGWCFAVDAVVLSVGDIPKNEPMVKDHQRGPESLGKFNSIFVGGIAHELGHAFSLPHCGERWDEKVLGTSLMGIGNLTYRDERRGEDKGSFLTMASAMKLASRPLFSKSDKELALAPRLEKSEFQVSTNVSRKDLAGRPGTLRIEGTVKGKPQVYGVIAYFNSIQDGGYYSPTATAVPDEKGRFAIEVSDLAPCTNGVLRIEYCHVNGAVSVKRAPFKVVAFSTNP
jgi:hypothetical protein